MTNITDQHRRAFKALTSGRYDNIALFSFEFDGTPAASFVAVAKSPLAEDGAEPEYVLQPLFISITGNMALTDRIGRAS